MELQFSVSAFIVKNKSFIVLKREQLDEFGKKGSWTIPCGRIEINENPIKAILREVKEETNLKIKVIKPLGVWNCKKEDTWRVNVCYICKYKSGKVKLSKEHSEFSWINLKNLNNSKLEKWIKDYAKIANKAIQ